MAINISNPIPLSPSLGHRLYEVVIFLYCLTSVNFKTKSTREPDLETATGKSPKHEFFCFVNKLGQICDNKLGGDTITAFAVLQPGSIQYRFASNNRDTMSLEMVKKYMTDILNTLGQTADSQLDTVHQQILGKVVAFNRSRIETYISRLLKKFDFCIETCESGGTPEAEKATAKLRSLQRLATSAAKETLSEVEFTTKAVAVLTAINTLYSTPFEDFTRTKARLDQDPTNRSPWSELRHGLGRLQSYSIAVNVLLSIRRRRQDLFEDFSVVYIPSTPPGETPNIRRSADGITRRMGAEATQAYRHHAAYLESIGLDKAIKSAAREREFQPIVHAEVNLLDSILNDINNHNPYDDEPVRFYGESSFGKYIGCSKPTCRLCGLYFLSHPSQVQVRQSHQNIYYKWRAPDVYEHQGEVARRKREEILEAMIKGVRNVIMETFGTGTREGLMVAFRKAHDSFTTPSNPYPFRSAYLSGPRGGEAGRGSEGIGEGEDLVVGVDEGDLVERFGEMGI